MIKPIALIGFYGSGKTGLARRVAAALSMPCSGLYAEIEKLSGMRVSTLHEKLGAAAFHKFESLALSSLAASGGVVATSGSCVMLPYNRRVLKDSFVTFFLDAPFASVLPCINGMARPTLKGLTREELFELYTLRKPQYAEIADYHLDATLPATQLESEIIDLALAEV